MPAWIRPISRRSRSSQSYPTGSARPCSALHGALGEAGTEPVRRGESGYALYAIELGEADVIGDEGTRIGSLAPGDTFGEIAMLVTGRRTASVVARTPMRLLTFFAADLERIRAGLPAVDRALRRLGGARLERSGAGDA